MDFDPDKPVKITVVLWGINAETAIRMGEKLDAALSEPGKDMSISQAGGGASVTFENKEPIA